MDGSQYMFVKGYGSRKDGPAAIDRQLDKDPNIAAQKQGLVDCMEVQTQHRTVM